MKKQVVSVKLDPDTHEEAKAIASLLHMDIGDYYAKSIQTSLEKDAAEVGVDLGVVRRKRKAKKDVK